MERAQEEVGAERRQVYHEQEAEAAAGVGEPDGEDHETAERDADGRRPWEDQPEARATARRARRAAEQRPVAAEREPARLDGVNELVSRNRTLANLSAIPYPRP